MSRPIWVGYHIIGMLASILLTGVGVIGALFARLDASTPTAARPYLLEALLGVAGTIVCARNVARGARHARGSPNVPPHR